MQAAMNGTIARRCGLLLAVLVLGGAAVWAAGFQDTSPGSAQALVLEVGRSIILRFEGMTRVAIVHHEIADVSVASSSELIVVADPEDIGKTGNTMLYVWDRRGLHKFAITVVGMNLAESIALDLQAILGSGLGARAMSRTVVVIEGQVADKVALDNLKQLAKASSTDDVQVVAMASAADGGDVSPAARAANALTSILDPSLKTTAWGTDVVVIEGELPTAEQVMQARGAISAFAGDLKIVDMITVKGETLASQAPVAQIQKMLGPDFLVTQLRGKLVAVDGVVASDGELDRVNSLLAAFEADGVQTINMVQVIPPKPDLGVAQNALQAALGDGVTVKRVGDEALMIEGSVPDEAHMDLHAMVQTNKARVLSEPNLLVNDGEEATILIGGEIPIPVVDNNAISIVYKQYGVNLKIKPAITPDGSKIILRVEPEVSSLDYSSGVVISGFTIPGMRTRRAATQVTMDDGSLLAIGGLIQNDQSKVISKIPLLGDLPIIGQFFRHSNVKNNRSELLILVIPQILDEDGQPVHPIPVPEGYPENFFSNGTD
jgi:Flp pilus assembly secretin CpaC